jgi:uncharacterized protein (DUF3820 family)
MSKCTRCKPYRPCLSHTRIPFGLYTGQTFDATPLGYLDWLSGQDWLYGPFRQRLTAYIKHPCIWQELQAMFPDPDAEPYDFEPSRQRREPMPKASHESSDWVPRPIRPMQLWVEAADWLLYFEQHNDPNDIFEVDFERLHCLCKQLPKLASTLRSAYSQFRLRLREAKAERYLSIYEYEGPHQYA